MSKRGKQKVKRNVGNNKNEWKLCEILKTMWKIRELRGEGSKEGNDSKESKESKKSEKVKNVQKVKKQKKQKREKSIKVKILNWERVARK